MKETTDESKGKALSLLFRLLRFPVATWFLVGVSIWIFVAPKNLMAIPIYLLIMMLTLIPVLYYRYIQNHKKPPSQFRRFSWTVFPIFAVLYVVIFSDNYYARHTAVNEIISKILTFSWFIVTVIPTMIWMVVASAVKYRRSSKPDNNYTRATFYFLTVIMGLLVALSTETASDWRPVFGIGLTCFAIVFIADFLFSLGFGRIDFPHFSQQTRLNIVVIFGFLALVFALVIFLIYLPENLFAQLTIGGLLSIGFMVMLYQGFIYFKDWREQQQSDKVEQEIAQGADLPDHYMIGNDGQIVELKKPRKRSKNPHQR